MTSVTSERGKGIFSKITFLKSLHSSKKDELCPSFEVEIFTKSLHRGGVDPESAYRQHVKKKHENDFELI